MASTVLGGAVEPPCWAAAAAMTAVAAASAAHMMLRTGYAGGRVSAIYILLLIYIRGLTVNSFCDRVTD